MTCDNSDLLTNERLSELLQRDVVSCELDATDLGKLNTTSYMRWATVKLGHGADLRVVLKVSTGNDQARRYGLAREGLFFKEWRQLAQVSKTPAKTCDLLDGFVPRIYFSEGDMAAGSKRILMEDLSQCVQAGYFFGPGNPNNWDKDLAKETAGEAFSGGSGTLSAEEVTRLCFSAAAKLHAGFWGCDIGAQFGWLRGASWLRGEDRESWDASQNGVKELWADLKKKVVTGVCEVKFDPFMVELLDASVASISWEKYQAESMARPLTLTHGDFHPANFMVKPQVGGVGNELVLLDWEVVGVGSGPQDLGQFMISHLDPAVRSKIEEAAVRQYFDELRVLNPEVAMSWEQCWAEYSHGGLGRWLWFVPMLCTCCPPKMGQFFHDQVFAFARGHGFTPDNIPMPRA